MNRNQLATLDEAKAIKEQLGAIGGGVVDIYVPPYGAPFRAPEDGDAKFYHFSFANGASGFNVGLIRTTIRNNPTRWPIMISQEVAQAATSGG